MIFRIKNTYETKIYMTYILTSSAPQENDATRDIEKISMYPIYRYLLDDISIFLCDILYFDISILKIKYRKHIKTDIFTVETLLKTQSARALES